MLEQISWKDFILFIGGSCAAYYGILVVAGKLTRKKPNAPATAPLTRRKWTPSPPTASPEPIATDFQEHAEAAERQPEEKEEDQEFAALELLADELQVSITQSAATPSGKEALLLQLRKTIARYPSLNKPAFVGAITNLVIKSVSEECSIDITTQEARELWPSPTDGIAS